jgi:hypothetical protein
MSRRRWPPGAGARLDRGDGSRVRAALTSQKRNISLAIFPSNATTEASSAQYDKNRSTRPPVLPAPMNLSGAAGLAGGRCFAQPSPEEALLAVGAGQAQRFAVTDGGFIGPLQAAKQVRTDRGKQAVVR